MPSKLELSEPNLNKPKQDKGLARLCSMNAVVRRRMRQFVELQPVFLGIRPQLEGPGACLGSGSIQTYLFTVLGLLFYG